MRLTKGKNPYLSDAAKHELQKTRYIGTKITESEKPINQANRNQDHEGNRIAYVSDVDFHSDIGIAVALKSAALADAAFARFRREEAELPNAETV